MVDLMFIRFVCGEINENSHVAAGIFCAAFDSIDEGVIPDYDYAELAELIDWFDLYLKGPFEYRLRRFWRAQRSICWFKSDACEYVKRAWLMMNILERNDVFMRIDQVTIRWLRHLRRRSPSISTAVCGIETTTLGGNERWQTKLYSSR